MKTINLLIFSISLAGLLVVTACGRGNEKDDGTAQHQEAMTEIGNKESEDAAAMQKVHEELQNNFAHQDIIFLKNVYHPSESTKRELKDVINAYLRMKDAFVNDNIAEADEAASLMQDKVKQVKPESMKGQGLEAWQQHANLYIDILEELRHTKDLQEKRSYFSHISEIVYCTIKSFGLHEDTELYAVFCPMAFDGKGAYWITESREIRNPYFGEEMLNCGEVKEKL
jgi:hypothetical protein